MLRSLWAGVSGLQAHQMALDIEGNNIANVNTAGFKYSRVNFSDMLSQTSKIATAPQGTLGGKNPMQVGLGTKIGSVTKIFKQGSVQTTDKNTDLAIQGDGFFVVSPDGGNTYKYTRNGNFNFDANGNFTDSNGYIVQGWKRDPTTGKVDSSTPISNITVPPGLTTPASPTSVVTIKANLNSGPIITNKSLIYGLSGADTNATTDAITGAKKSLDMSMLFNDSGDALSLKNGDNFNIDINGTTTTYTYNGTTALGANEFKTTNDLRDLIQTNVATASTGATVIVNPQGKFEVTNPSTGTAPVTLDVTAGSQNNQNLLDMITPLSGAIPTDGSSKISQAFSSATHASSIDIYDSLGTKHTLRTEFRKISQTSNGSTWQMVLSVPSPSEINTTTPKNYIVGNINFNSNGAFSTATPPSINFTGNNGSKPNQTVQLDFGTAGQFDGMTSFDATSNTSGISQDGFPGGDLSGIRVDETGTLIGSFTNGRSFGLAQVSMAKFSNNNALQSDGGDTFIQTSNSGDPVIGQASTGGRGFIQASALEMSNVDLSRSLTQLIIIQRGFQANAKTITTSDQILNTLLQLKQ